jgi:hypothetical protein
MDSAFTAQNNPAVISLLEQEANAHTLLDVIVFEEATKLQQSAEWVMRAIKSAFPRCKDSIHFE